MTTEEMADRLERDAKFYDDHRTPILTAIARRLRLLDAVASIGKVAHAKVQPACFTTQCQNQDRWHKALADLDADERGGRE